MTILSDRFLAALDFALETHQGGVRKGTEIPYFSHLLQVSGLVLEFGGTEDEAIGALLHDAAEDEGGEETLAEILRRFGSQVESIVRQNSDSITSDKDSKAPWLERKTHYIAGIVDKTPDALLVSICDKLHNARSLNQDTRSLGPTHWNRFNAAKEDSLWYYQSLVTAFEKRVVDDKRLASAVTTLKLEVELLNH
jgi:(p)ppGpp synthase/HD superfamily hydrolase